MDEPIQCSECSAVHGVPVLHSPDSHATSAYLNKPMGIPHVARFRKDGGGLAVIAAGEEQVARYMAAKSDEEYVAGEEAIEREGK